MKVLFVSSGNNKNGISPIIRNQALSLQKQGIEVDFFLIKGRGIRGYLSNIPAFLRECRENNYDLVHAHYFDSALVPTLSFTRIPVIVSLMGSDVYESAINRALMKLFNRFSWAATIVKSEDLKTKSGIKHAHIIPNGIDLERLQPMDKQEARKSLSLDPMKKFVLFLANPARPEKNIKLAKEAVRLLKDDHAELLTIHGIDNEKVVLYLNAADVVLMTSLWEGSPNVVKEAMACNRPVVSTRVGDVGSLLEGVEGSFVCNHDPQDVMEKISRALIHGTQTNSRQRLIELGLDEKSIARRINDLYANVNNQQQFRGA